MNTLYKSLIGLAFLASGCAVEPEAVLAEADVELSLAGIDANAVRLDVTVRRDTTEVVLRQPEVAGDAALTLYLFDLPQGDLTVVVQAVGAAEAVVQCTTLALQHAGDRQTVVVDLAAAMGPCPVEPDGLPDGDGDDHPDDHTDEAGPPRT